jgi:hypothetical protein
MNYQEFRDLFHQALKAARRLIPYPIGPTERINLRDRVTRDSEPMLQAAQELRQALADAEH